MTKSPKPAPGVSGTIRNPKKRRRVTITIVTTPMTENDYKNWKIAPRAVAQIMADDGIAKWKDVMSIRVETIEERPKKDEEAADLLHDDLTLMTTDDRSMTRAGRSSSASLAGVPKAK